LRDSSESCAGSAAVVEEALCMEKRLDWELDGVRTVLATGDGGNRSTVETSERVGVVP
jgi:hypothetical protein